MNSTPPDERFDAQVLAAKRALPIMRPDRLDLGY
jgi:hypothetical protein